jgi:hypothetical protein
VRQSDHLTAATFQTRVLDTDEAFVLFGQSGDTGSYHAQQLLNTLPAQALYLDIDLEPQAAMKYNIRFAPFLCVFRKGSVALSFAGFAAIAEYLDDYKRAF